MNFLYNNSIVPDTRRQTITVGKTVFPETNSLNVSKSLALQTSIKSKPIGNPNCFKISVKEATLILPRDVYTVKLPPNLPHNHPYVVQPVGNLQHAVPGQPKVETSWPSVRSVQAAKGKFFAR